MWPQVTLTLATLGKPDLGSTDALGYELTDDALRFLKALGPSTGKQCPESCRVLLYLYFTHVAASF